MKFRFHALALVFCLTTPLRADWQDVCGFTRLQALAGSELPSAPSQGLTQVEAPDGSGFFAPDTTNALFADKTFTLKSASSGVSTHATHVSTNYYGSASQIPGTAAVDVYNANDWIGTSFLQTGGFSAPSTETRAVQNHSWVGTSSSTTTDTEILRRLDFAINRDGFVCVVGSDNNGSTTLPDLLCQSYNTISVGRDDGGHSAGFTTIDGTGRIKPDIVAPSASPEYATSWTTPMVSGAAGLLYAKLSASPYSLTGADRPRVVKALLLASARKDNVASWSNTSTRPLDLRFGAGNLNTYHAYSTLRSGRATASGSTLYPLRGWAAETVSANTTKTYFFNIPAGAPSTPFSAALTWHATVSHTPNWTWSTSLANLNLYLYQANGFTKGSLVTSSLSTVDNVQLVYQSALVPGNYALVVENKPTSTSTAYGLAWHSLPAVTVAATTPTARESDGQQGVITLTRTGDTTLPLYVPLTIGGTAVAGTHYQALPANVTIPAGQSTYVLQVIPVSDNIAQGDRTVTVSVAADFALVLDTSQSAVVIIQDKPFDAWRFANFTSVELGNPAISGATADPDGDHLPNLVEYALGLPPKSPSVSPVTMIDVSGYLAISVAKNSAATDITWGAEVSGNLVTWTPATIVTNTTGAFSARDTVLKSAAAKRFIRLKITRP